MLVYQSPVEQSNVRQMRDVWKKMVLPSVLETLVKIAKERSSILCVAAIVCRMTTCVSWKKLTVHQDRLQSSYRCMDSVPRMGVESPRGTVSITESVTGVAPTINVCALVPQTAGGQILRFAAVTM